MRAKGEAGFCIHSSSLTGVISTIRSGHRPVHVEDLRRRLSRSRPQNIHRRSVAAACNQRQRRDIITNFHTHSVAPGSCYPGEVRFGRSGRWGWLEGAHVCVCACGVCGRGGGGEPSSAAGLVKKPDPDQVHVNICSRICVDAQRAAAVGVGWVHPASPPSGKGTCKHQSWWHGEFTGLSQRLQSARSLQFSNVHGFCLATLRRCSSVPPLRRPLLFSARSSR